MSEHQCGQQPLPAGLQPVKIGRYLLHRQIARGGMATIHIARLIGDEGFSRIVAAKRLLPELAEDFEFLAMFLDEAEIASRIHHCNVVPVLDVVTTGTEAVLIQEYVYGVPLHWLLHAARRTRTRIPVGLAVSIACQALAGLHAAHETRDELGMPLNVVHRDVSPHNLMIAFDGTVRLLDFGIAKAVMATHLTREGQFKGKLAYAAPEQLRGQATRQSDLYSLAAVLWELIVGHDIHHRVQTDVELLATVMNGKLQTITEALAVERASIGSEEWRALEAIEPIIKIGLSLAMSERWGTAADMAQALADAVRPVSPGSIAVWLKSLGAEFIDNHDRVLAAEEVSWRRIGATMRYQIAPVHRELAFETCVSAPPSRAAATMPRSGSNASIRDAATWPWEWPWRWPSAPCLSSVRQLPAPRRNCRRPAPAWHQRWRFRPPE